MGNVYSFARPTSFSPKKPFLAPPHLLKSLRTCQIFFSAAGNSEVSAGKRKDGEGAHPSRLFAVKGRHVAQCRQGLADSLSSFAGGFREGREVPNKWSKESLCSAQRGKGMTVEGKTGEKRDCCTLLFLLSTPFLFPPSLPFL